MSLKTSHNSDFPASWHRPLHCCWKDFPAPFDLGSIPLPTAFSLPSQTSLFPSSGTLCSHLSLLFFKLSYPSSSTFLAGHTSLFKSHFCPPSGPSPLVHVTLEEFWPNPCAVPSSVPNVMKDHKFSKQHWLVQSLFYSIILFVHV